MNRKLRAKIRQLEEILHGRMAHPYYVYTSQFGDIPPKVPPQNGKWRKCPVQPQFAGSTVYMASLFTKAQHASMPQPKDDMYFEILTDKLHRLHAHPDFVYAKAHYQLFPQDGKLRKLLTLPCGDGWEVNGDYREIHIGGEYFEICFRRARRETDGDGTPLSMTIPYLSDKETARVKSMYDHRVRSDEPELGPIHFGEQVIRITPQTIMSPPQLSETPWTAIDFERVFINDKFHWDFYNGVLLIYLQTIVSGSLEPLRIVNYMDEVKCPASVPRVTENDRLAATVGTTKPKATKKRAAKKAPVKKAVAKKATRKTKAK